MAVTLYITVPALPQNHGQIKENHTTKPSTTSMLSSYITNTTVMIFNETTVESISIMNSTESATSTEMKYSDTIIDSATSTDSSVINNTTFKILPLQAKAVKTSFIKNDIAYHSHLPTST